MRPTAIGVKAALFYLLLVGAFFAAPYANHFFLLLVFLTILGVVDVLFALANVAGLTGRVDEVEPGPDGAGQALSGWVAGGRRTRVAVCLELDVEGCGPILLSGGLIHGETQLRGRLPALPRGLYRVTSARLCSRWPMGLIRAQRPVPAPREIVVYPAPAPRPDAPSTAAGRDELCGQAAPEGFLQPSGLREYRPGDELRRVHWKASARRRSLIVQEWEGGHGGGAEVLLDLRCETSVLESSLRMLAALALDAREREETLTLHTQGLSATFGGQQRPWRELLRFLAQVQPLPADGAAPPPVSPGVPRMPR